MQTELEMWIHEHAFPLDLADPKSAMAVSVDDLRALLAGKVLCARVSRPVSREECSEEAWDLLHHFAGRTSTLENELVSAYKRLCKYEGHLPITMGDETLCEKCEKPSTEWGKD